MRPLAFCTGLLALLPATGCLTGDLSQVIGVGHSYSTRCSARMAARGDTFFARCTPPSCATSHQSAVVNHVVVALEPGVQVLGYAERICLRTTSEVASIPEPTEPVPEPSAPL